MRGQVEAFLLGTAQDGGVPQAGCRCTTCDEARRDSTRRRLVACLALIDHAAGASWLIDATPDFPQQLDQLMAYAPYAPLAGIILSHAHIGHYTGLIHLGREVMGTAGLPLYATSAMAGFLRSNGPWSQLVSLGNVVLRELIPDQPVALTAALTITPVVVPHRAEFSDTLAIFADGSQRRLCYCPDIDRWEQLDQPLTEFLAGSAVALLDGTFYSSDELPGRDMREIPHPPVRTTVDVLAGSGHTVGFIHLNHSNPLLRDGPAQAWLSAQGHWVAQEGMTWVL